MAVEIISIGADVEYSDGAEGKLRTILSNATDRSVASPELARAIDDWPTLYHLSPLRTNLLRPLSVRAGCRVLDVGAGAGSLARFLGEAGASVVALEGTAQRAELAALRCRGLAEVTVLSGSVHDLRDPAGFDIVVCVGVYEYAHRAPGRAAFLRALRTLTRPGGVLVLAIENQIGLKYLLGYGEDHLGDAWVGVEGYPARGTRTFSRAALHRQLQDAGFPAQRWLYPFPDYKLPRVVISESAYESRDAVDFVDQLVRWPCSADASAPRLLCDDRAAHRVLLEGGLGKDVANSFLVVAAAAPEAIDRVLPSEVRAWHFSTDRCRPFIVEKEFTDRTPTPEVRLRGDVRPSAAGWLAHRRDHKRPFIIGRTVEGLALEACLDGRAELARVLTLWREHLRSLEITASPGPEHPFLGASARALLPPHYLDVGLSNFVLPSTGVPTYIDDEWQATPAVDADLVCARSLWGFALDLVRRGGRHPWGPSLTVDQLTEALGHLCQVPVDDDLLRRWRRAEGLFQAAVTGRPAEFWEAEILAAGRLTQGSQAVTRRLPFAKLEALLSDLSSRNLELENRTASLEASVRTVACEASSRAADVARLASQLASREREVTGLGAEVASQGGQIRKLSSELSVREDEIRRLRTAVAARDSELAHRDSELARLRRSRLLRAGTHARQLLTRLRGWASWSEPQSDRPLGHLPGPPAEVRAIADSGIFDVAHYASQGWGGGDLADAIEHYLREGARLGFNPHPLFDTSFYLDGNPDVASSGYNPLLHFLEAGARERRDPSSLFDASYYLEKYPDVAAAGVNPLCHYLAAGASEGRSPNPYFDTAYYLTQNPDVVAAGMNPLVHYLLYGGAEGRKPNPDFDPWLYLGMNSEISASGANPLVHYVTSGLKAGRPCRLSDIRAPQPNRLGPRTTPVRLALGVVAFQNTEESLSRLLESALRSAKSSPIPVDVSLAVHRNSPEPFTLSGASLQVFGDGTNLGFGVAHNDLMRRAFEQGADCYLGPNPDGEFHPAALGELLRMLEADEGASLIEAMQFPEEHPKWYDPESFDTPWISGACFLLSKKIWAAVGGFDPNLFLYCEDVDLSWRARVAGFRTRMCPSALFYHDVASRTHEPWRHRLMLLAGRYLAQKWGSRSFLQQVDAELGDGETRGETLPVFQGAAEAAARGITDFRHQFSFAPVRW